MADSLDAPTVVTAIDGEMALRKPFSLHAEEQN